MQGREKCHGCGYPLNPRGGGGTTKADGHRWHVGCFFTYVFHKKKTAELLEKVAELRKKEEINGHEQERST